MNILITGGAGFIGSHLAEMLLGGGHRVTVIDDLSTGSLRNIQGIADHSQFRFVLDSVRNETVMNPPFSPGLLMHGCHNHPESMSHGTVSDESLIWGDSCFLTAFAA